MAFWIAITAIATAAIAYLAWSNNNLAKEMKKTGEKHDREMKELFKTFLAVEAIAKRFGSEEELNYYVQRFWNEAKEGVIK